MQPSPFDQFGSRQAHFNEALPPRLPAEQYDAGQTHHLDLQQPQMQVHHPQLPYSQSARSDQIWFGPEEALDVHPGQMQTQLDPRLPPESPAPSHDLSDVPFNEKWDLLEPVIRKLYQDPKIKLSELIDIMKTKYSFDANESQYKYRFKKWGWKKNISQSKKIKLLDITQRRAQEGKSTTITYQGRLFDSKKLRRQAKVGLKKEVTLTPSQATVGDVSDAQLPPLFLFRNSIFLKWNMPFGVGVTAAFPDHPSPFGVNHSTPSDVVVNTPPLITAPSPQNAPSPLSVALKKKTAIEKASLFVGGKHDELLRSLNVSERKTMSTWLYQFWLFSFTTAKYWGTGPRIWTAANLGFTVSPSSIVNTPVPQFALEDPMDLDAANGDKSRNSLPEPLCRWSIHIYQDDYERLPSPERVMDETNNGLPIGSPWPQSWEAPVFEERLSNNLETNDFSTLATDQLPIARSQIAQAAERSPNELLKEALGFAIMGRNFELVDQTCKKIKKANIDVSDLYPYHLATTYLDGSRTCCHVLSVLILWFGYSDTNSVRQLQVNDAGHTILDTLMVTILKGHSSLSPGMLDDTLRKETRFPGEETDICGRWDADSECYRSLLLSQEPRVPFYWKHKFCHTSAQAITHCIKVLSGNITIAFFLGRHGCIDEDLFGMVACLLALLTSGVDPCQRAEISIALILDTEQEAECTHENVTAFQLAKRLSKIGISRWTEKASDGWWVFCEILRQASGKHLPYNSDLLSTQQLARQRRAYFDSSNTEERGNERPEDEHNEEDDSDGDGELDDWSSTLPLGFAGNCDWHLGIEKPKAFGRNEILGHIWAAIQTELITYRRLENGDTWVSQNFSWECLVRDLKARADMTIPLVQGDMMTAYCACGEFNELYGNVRSSDACKYYFSNMEDWKRTSFLEDSMVDG